MDEEPHEGDEEQHDRRQRVEPQGEVDRRCRRQRSSRTPCRRGVAPCMPAYSNRMPSDQQQRQRRSSRRRPPTWLTVRKRCAPARSSDGAGEGEDGNEPEQVRASPPPTSASRSGGRRRSTAACGRSRPAARGPTATSAAATAITKNTKTWPSSWPCWREKATRVRFAGVEHQLDAEQDRDAAAPQQHAAGADGEQQRRRGSRSSWSGSP